MHAWNYPASAAPIYFDWTWLPSVYHQLSHKQWWNAFRFDRHIHTGIHVKTHTLVHASLQQTEIQTIRPTHQLFTSARSNQNNMSQFEKSICEGNLKLWSSIWSLHLSPSAFLWCQWRECSVAWGDDRSLWTLTTCIILTALKCS